MRRYKGDFVDSIRWHDFPLRNDDVIITTPAKCGTTWMQNIVGMLLLGKVDLGEKLGLLSPWMDLLTVSTDEVYGLLAAQNHRRFIKTHTALDGLPDSDSVTYLAMVRHPLDAALSLKDHFNNMSFKRLLELRAQSSGGERPNPPRAGPDDPQEFLRGWIEHDPGLSGIGAIGLADFAHQARTYWDARHRPNVHLFHYDDLEADLDGEMRRVAAALGVPVDEASWAGYVEAATFDSMRARAAQLTPEVQHEGFWHSVDGFFKSAGRRNWTELLTEADFAHYKERLVALAGPELAEWVDRPNSG